MIATAPARRLRRQRRNPIHYPRTGTGPPLLVLHGGGPQTDADWTWAAVLEQPAKRHRFRSLTIVAGGTTAPGGVLNSDGRYSADTRARDHRLGRAH